MVNNFSAIASRRARRAGLVVLVFGGLLSACSKSPDAPLDQLKQHPEILGEAIRLQLEQQPELIFNAIRDNPEAFMTVAAEAAEERRRLAQERQLDAAFADPKQPEIGPERAVFGNPEAPVTIVEYSDFECPYCAAVTPTIARLLEEYSDQVRVVYKHLPLGFHELAQPAARYFEAIAMQDTAKAKAFHDTLFDNHRVFSASGELYLQQTAEELGIDLAQLSRDLESAEVQRRIDADSAEAGEFGIKGTPGFLINGVPLSGAKPYEAFKAIIDRHLLAEG